MENELDVLFEGDGIGEKFPHDEVNDGEDGKIGELAALFSDDEEDKENIQSPANTNSPDKLREEYEALQRKMDEIKQKMNQSLTTSPQNDVVKPKNSNEKQNKDSSHFLAAFGSIKPAIKENSSSLNSKAVEKTSTKNFYGKRPRQDDAMVSHQSCKRIAHESNAKNMPTRGVLKELPITPVSVRKTSTITKSKQTIASPVATEKFTRMRLKKCVVSSEDMTSLMQGKRFLPLHTLRPAQSISADVDWVTIGVIAKKADRQAAKNGKAFSIWNLVDLNDCSRIVTFFLFGRVHDQLKSINPGTVIGLLNPTIMPPKNDDKSKNYDNAPALTVDVSERVMNIGEASDIGWCSATKWRNKQAVGTCLAPVNKQYNEVCPQHMQAKYKKLSSKRGELHGSPAAPLPEKYKNTMWNKVKGDQFFYGGKTFSAAPPSLQSGKMPVSKIKLSKVSSVTNGSPSSNHTASRSRVIGAMVDLKEEQSVTGCSETFADMLTSGDMVAGSRHFLGHLKSKQKSEEESNNPAQKLTPSQFLKQQKTLFETKNITKSPSLNSRTFSKPTMASSNKVLTIEDIKKKTAAIAQIKPKLQRPNLNNGGNNEIDLSDDFSLCKTSMKGVPSLAELRKRKALAKLRGIDGKIGLTKKDPNSIKTTKDCQKVLKKVEENRIDLKQKSPQKSPEEKEKTGTGFLGMKLSAEEIDKIAGMESTHTHELKQAEAENEENYFKPKIQKEMLEQKMAETYEIPTKIVQCVQCKYTYWGPHDRCKVMKHKLVWKDAVKRFFQCKCKQRCVTWTPYPTKTCKDCGSEKFWTRTSMLNRSDAKILESEILMIRGIEHEKFLNSFT